MEAASAYADQDSTAILHAIVDATCAFSGDTPLADDFTCFVIQRAAE